MGYKDLGVDFKLHCILPESGTSLHLRDLDPVEPVKTTQAVLVTNDLGSCESPDLDMTQSCYLESLVSLRDMTRLPAGFSILAENRDVVILRHILRDSMVILPKNSLTVRSDKGRQVGTEDVPGPNGYITEWFPCRYSLFRVERGLIGVPHVLIYCNVNVEQVHRVDW